MRFLSEHTWGEGTPVFPKLYRIVYAIAILSRARVGQNRAVSESAGAELHASLKPTEETIFREQFGGSPGWVVEMPIGELENFEDLLDFVVCEFGTQIGMADGKTRQGQSKFVINGIGSADACPIITGGRLNVDVINQTGAEKVAVRFAIQGDSACQTKIAGADKFGRAAYEGEHGLPAGVLSRTSEVVMTLGDFFAIAAGTDNFLESGTIVIRWTEEATPVHRVGIRS